MPPMYRLDHWRVFVTLAVLLIGVGIFARRGRHDEMDSQSTSHGTLRPASRISARASIT